MAIAQSYKKAPKNLKKKPVVAKKSSLADSVRDGKRVAFLKENTQRRATLKRVALALSGSKLVVDRAGGSIKNVAVMSDGDTGYGFNIDQTSRQQMAALINQESDGMKMHFQHPETEEDAQGNVVGVKDQLGKMVGRLKNAKQDGDTLRADVQLGEYAKSMPGLGNVHDYLMTMADKDPSGCGLSAVFNWDPEVIMGEDGRPKMIAARITQGHQVDFVGQGAATPNGLLKAAAMALLADAPVVPDAAGVGAAFTAVSTASRTAIDELRKLLDAGAAADVAGVVAACGASASAVRMVIDKARACIDLCAAVPPGGIVDQTVADAANTCQRTLSLLSDECCDARDFLDYRVYGTTDLARAAAMCVPLLRICGWTADDLVQMCWPMTYPVAELASKRVIAGETAALAVDKRQLEIKRLARRIARGEKIN